MTAHRGIAALASAMMICFLVLSTMEPEFVLLHFYQSLIYLIIVLMLFYFHDRWAYMIGMITSVVWLLLAVGLDLVGGAMRQVSRIARAERPTNEVEVVAGIMVILSLLLIAVCGYRWKRQYSGMGKTLSTFMISFVVVAIYYAILIVGFYKMFPGA